MGFVDDDSESEADGQRLNPQHDEEASLANDERSPFQESYHISSLIDLRTPTTRSSDMMSTTGSRRKGITESDEIWEELEDDTVAEYPPFSRRSTARFPPSSKSLSKGNPINDPPDESTALLARSSTGRSYRDKRRRQSVPLDEPQDRERRRKSASSQEALGGWWRMKWWNERKEGPDKLNGGPDRNR